MLAWFTACLVKTAIAAVPVPITTTPAEEAMLRQGDIVVRDQGSGETVGIADVQSTPKRTLEALLDLQARVNEVRPIQSIRYIEQTPEKIIAEWKVGMLGINSRFHIWYETDWNQGFTRFGIDTTRENDIDHASGSYHVYAHNGGTRLVYRNDADPKSKVPNWVREMLTSRSMRQQIAGITARAAQP